MKKIVYRLSFMLLALSVLFACSKDDEAKEPQYLPVNYANVAGTWQLMQWNGNVMPEGSYCYLVILRAPDSDTGIRHLEIYQNLDSDKSRHITSTYSITPDEDDACLGVITGQYDFAFGFWNHDYYVGKVRPDSMEWTVTDDEGDVSVYTRVSTVPDDIVAGTRAE